MTHLTQCIKGGSKEGRSGYILAFFYDPETVEALKRAVPHTDREWREDTLTWWVDEKHTAVLKSLFPNFEALAFMQGKLL